MTPKAPFFLLLQCCLLVIGQARNETICLGISGHFGTQDQEILNVPQLIGGREFSYRCILLRRRKVYQRIVDVGTRTYEFYSYSDVAQLTGLVYVPPMSWDADSIGPEFLPFSCSAQCFLHPPRTWNDCFSTYSGDKTRCISRVRHGESRIVWVLEE